MSHQIIKTVNCKHHLDLHLIIQKIQFQISVELISFARLNNPSLIKPIRLLIWLRMLIWNFR